MVSTWSSHLDPDDGVMIDISPRSLGNQASYPDGFAEYDLSTTTIWRVGIAASGMMYESRYGEGIPDTIGTQG